MPLAYPSCSVMRLSQVLAFASLLLSGCGVSDKDDVEDDKGNMTGGELKNGAPDDFKDVPVVEETP